MPRIDRVEDKRRLREEEAVPLDDATIHAILPDVRVTPYSALADTPTVWQLLGPTGQGMGLYEGSSGSKRGGSVSGHWVAICQSGGGLDYFDSYGLAPDDELAYFPAAARRRFGEVEPRLKQLLRESGMPVTVSTAHYQGASPGIET